jgi:hypothetical protein
MMAKMTTTRRLGSVVAGLVVLFVAYALTLELPGVRFCDGWCSRSFDPGDVPVFGRYMFTLAQTIVLGAGIWAGGSFVSRAILPHGFRWTAVASGAFVLSIVVALSLPSSQTGPAPSVPCSTPGPDGPNMGACQTGPPPMDERPRDRALVLAAGLTPLVIGVSLDRRRARPAP